MSKEPLVSVIIPTYNRADFLERAIESVLSQNYENLELIVVDDASTDNTSDIIKKISDGRIKYIRNEVNKGGPAARNIGIKAAQGKFIAFQDSDDEWLWGKIKKQIEVFDSCDNNVGVVYTGFLRWQKQSAEYIPHPKIKIKEGNIISQIFLGNFVSTQTLLVRKELLEKVGFFDEQLPRFQDWELVMRLAKECKFKLIDQPMVMVFSTPGNITSNNIAGMKSMEIILKKHYLFLSDHPKLLSRFLYIVGREKCINESVKEGRPYFADSLKINSHNIKAYIAWSVSLFGRRVYTFLSR